MKSLNMRNQISIKARATTIAKGFAREREKGKGGTSAGAGGVTTLDEEVLDDTVEDGVVVIAFKAKLNEVSDGFRSLLWPELNVERTARRVQHHLTLRRRF